MAVTGHPLFVRTLGQRLYLPVWEAMRDFTLKREPTTVDELWLVEHPAVFTQGLAGKTEHVLQPKDIPVVQTDRGGQVTYHGPGQLVAYTLIDLTRQRMGVRELVQSLESVVIGVLEDYGIQGNRRSGAPGVYVGEAKIAALGLRVKNGRSYHGLSLNVRMDLEPFQRINPCGYPGLAITQLSELTATADTTIEGVSTKLIAALCQQLKYEPQNGAAKIG